MADVSSLSFLAINAFTNFSCSALRLDLNKKGLSIPAATRSGVLLLLFLYFSLCFFSFYLRFVVAPFSVCLLLVVQSVSLPSSLGKTFLFYLPCGCKTLISISVFRKICVLFLVWHWSSCGTFQFMPSPNNTYVPPMCFPSIPPASFWVLLSHAPILEAHKGRLTLAWRLLWKY